MANQTLQLADLLRREGAAVELVEVNAPYRPKWIEQVPMVRALFRLVPYAVRTWQAAGRAEVAHVMASSGWAWHLCAAPAVWLASIRRIPVIVNYRGGGAEAFFARSMRWVRPTLARCTAIIVPSPFLERIFRQHGFHAEIIPNIIDMALFSPGERPGGTRTVASAAPHLVVSRNLEPVYDIGTALRAFRIVKESIPGARLSVAGSGPARVSLEALARELGIDGSVVFTGRLENREMAAVYREADLSLNPSLADNMPISILEALASGVPVVSTDVGGIPDLVTAGVTAVLVPPSEPAAMAAAALGLLSDPERRSRQIRAGIDYVRRFTWEQVRERLLATYRDAARRAARSSPARTV
jgi:glycosyltransferase involved in cell wall biosynthesis